MRLADPALYQEIVTNRISDSEAPYVVYCVNCREVFRSRGKDCRHILEGLLNMERNSMKVKVRLLDKYKKERFLPPQQECDGIRLSISAEVRATMEEKMISDADVRECIWQAEKNGDGFWNPEDSTVLACLVRNALTNWDCYQQTADDSFIVQNAYCHRMHFRENE